MRSSSSTPTPITGRRFNIPSCLCGTPRCSCSHDFHDVGLRRYIAAATTRTLIMTTLTGKTALVTGASRGMGRASALALAAAGAQVLVHYGLGANEADGVVAEIRKVGGRADAIATDLAAADGATKLARQARSIVGDRLDIIVGNAGVSKAATIEETTGEDFDKPFAVNVRAP